MFTVRGLIAGAFLLTWSIASGGKLPEQAAVDRVVRDRRADPGAWLGLRDLGPEDGRIGDRGRAVGLATSFSYVNPVVALFLGWLLFEEPLSVGMLLAVAVIVTGVCLIVSTRGQAPCSPHHPLTSGQGHLYVVRGAGRPMLVVETPEVLARLDQR